MSPRRRTPPAAPAHTHAPPTAALPATVDAGIWLRRAEVPPPLFGALLRALTFPNPAYERLVRVGRPTYAEPATLCVLEEHGDRLRAPRGAVGIVKRLAAEQRLALRWDDQRVTPVERIAVPRTPTARTYQAQAATAFVAAGQGTIVIPCGGGKTITALAVIARLATPTLVVVASRDLATQWCAQVASVLGIEAGLIAGGSRRRGPVTIVMAQALARWTPTDRDALLASVGLLVVDEAHHAPARLFRDVVGNCPARYRLGLTATPDREDGLTPLIELYLGPEVARVDHHELIDAGVLVLPTIRTLATTFEFPYFEPSDYAPLLEAVASDESRTAAIADAIAVEASGGHTCLALSGRVDHCERLRAALGARGVEALVLTSAVTKRARTDALARARAGTVPVLIATSLADEGLDIERLDRVFLTFPARAKGRTIQRLGRVMRPHPSKRDAVVIDVVDERVAVLRRHAAARRATYRQVFGIDVDATASAVRPGPRA